MRSLHWILAKSLIHIFVFCALMVDLAAIQFRDLMLKIHPRIGFCLNIAYLCTCSAEEKMNLFMICLKGS